MVSISFLQSATMIKKRFFLTRNNNSIISFGGISYQFNLHLIEFKHDNLSGQDKILKGCLTPKALQKAKKWPFVLWHIAMNCKCCQPLAL
jgi:hypothetical protein